MSYSVEGTQTFIKQLKRLIKKYPSLKEEYANLIRSLVSNPTQGESLGKNCYKIRISISSKNKGTSGGTMVITFVHMLQTKVFLLTIYDKSEKDNISDRDLVTMLLKIKNY